MSVAETKEASKYTVEQHRFLASGDVTADEDETVWVLNLGVATKSNSEVFYSSLASSSRGLFLTLAARLSTRT